MLSTLPLAGLITSCAWLQAQGASRTLIEWNFDQDVEGWGGANFITELRVEAGALQGRIMDWDPFVRSPQFEIPASPWQAIEVRLKTDCGGTAEVFWTGTLDSPYGGFSPGKETFFTVVGDNEWHTYTLRPYWHREGKIILLRLDFPKPGTADNGKKTFAVDFVRVVEPTQAAQPDTATRWDFTKGAAWSGEGVQAEATAAGLEVTLGLAAEGRVSSGPLEVAVEDRAWVSIDMAVSAGETGQVHWVSGAHSGIQSVPFPIRADGRFHTYNVDLSASGAWAENLLWLGLTPSGNAGTKATVRSIALSEDPLGPPEIEVTYAGLEDATNRVGRPLPFILSLTNRGGETAGDLRIGEVKLPPQVSVVDQGDWRTVSALEPFDPHAHRLLLTAAAPVKGEAVVTLTGQGAPTEPVKAEFLIEAGLNLPKADYVPEPQPVESDYELGAFYFPGWGTAASWDPIRRIGPERKPVLGWYNEGNPECVDWQIKWAVEHGISFFLVDWYWSAGGRHLEHWVQAFEKARYRKYLKWCMMWANHNAPNTHSEDDQRAVTQYWLDHCFNMPEYYRINDMPVVMIWSVGNMERDLAGKGGAKRLLDISQEMVRAAGYKGIYFVAMKWPEAGTDAKIIEPLKEAGFSMTSIYHYMDHGGKAEDWRRFPFELCAESTYPWLKAWHEAGILDMLPNLATGWDSRPWHGDQAQVIHGRTVELFRRICQDAKRFADETGVKRLALAPLNEWGEGSYAEPNKEFGFGMYDVVRDIFCKQPPGGWPPNIAPQDVGLGPYDYAEPPQRFTWDFSDSLQGWGAMMGVTDLRAEGGALVFTTNSADPAITCATSNLSAKRYPYLMVRMAVDSVTGDGESGQLFWTTPTAGTSESASVKWPLARDGQIHEYVVHLAENARWHGRITTFRLDPCSHAGAQVTIDEVRLSTDGK